MKIMQRIIATYGKLFTSLSQCKKWLNDIEESRKVTLILNPYDRM